MADRDDLHRPAPCPNQRIASHTPSAYPPLSSPTVSSAAAEAHWQEEVSALGMPACVGAARIQDQD